MKVLTSSYHPCCATESGDFFVPGNAIDGDTVSYLNDATQGSTNSWLEVSTPAPVTLPGLTLLFDKQGVPIDFQMQTLDDATGQLVTQAMTRHLTVHVDGAIKLANIERLKGLI